MLENLYKKGIERETDISEEVVKYFRNAKLDVWQRYLRVEINDLYEPLVKEGYILLSNKTDTNVLIGQRDWLKSINVTAALTSKGVVFFYELRKFNADNKTLTIAIVGLFLTGIFSTINAVVSYNSLSISKQLAKDASQIQPVQKRLEQAKELIQKQQIQIDSLFLRMTRSNPEHPHSSTISSHNPPQNSVKH